MTETELKTNDKPGLTSIAEKPSAESQAVAVVAENQPVVAEIELKPLAIPHQLPLAGGAELAEPAVGFWGRYRLFIVTVVLPMMIASGFLLFIAAPRYSSSASFIVRSADQNSTHDAMTSLAQSTRVDDSPATKPSLSQPICSPATSSIGSPRTTICAPF